MDHDHFLHASKHKQQNKISCSRVGHGKVSAVDVPCDVGHIRNKQQASSVCGTRTALSDSWDTDFSDDDDDDDDDDDISKVSDMNRQLTLKCTIKKICSGAHCNK
jgi:hypothetical protein